MTSSNPPIRILGAGLSGLSCAINLAKAGEQVEVHERRADVGQQSKPNWQGLLHTHGSYRKYLNDLNLDPEFKVQELSRIHVCTYYKGDERDIDVAAAEAIPVVLRGGPESLEYGLYKQAKDLGVQFEFKAKTPAEDVSVVATGHQRVDMTAFGGVFEGTDYGEEHILYMYDNRFSPTGWYLYAIPYGDGAVEIVNCCSQPYVGEVKQRFYSALKERKILKDIVGDRKPVHTFGGFGGSWVPRTAIEDGRYLVGEAAGFQDPFRGFGMNFALESGKFAADAIVNGIDYDKAWKDKFTAQFKLDYARRYAFVLLGDWAPYKYFKKYSDGETVDFNKITPSGGAAEVAKHILYKLAHMRRRLRGYW